MFLREEMDRVPAVAPAQELASTLSGLLRQAVEDVQRVEKLPGYVLDMSRWHSPIGDSCYVCMAGAVMACRLGMPRDMYATSLFKGADAADWPVEAKKMNAINYLRVGRIPEAYLWVLGERAKGPALDGIEPIEAWFAQLYGGARHGMNFHADWEHYLEMADKLEAIGL